MELEKSKQRLTYDDITMGLIVGNWKMNTTVTSAIMLANAVKVQIEGQFGPEVVVCPPYVSLYSVSETLRGSRISVGAQNMHSETNNGAFTGEISAEMLAQICQYVIVGHSERRTYFSETDLFINLKLLAALSADITPILCVGEKREDRDSGRAHDIVSSQLDANLNGMDLDSKIVVAYEPVWAIGTGQSASPEIAQDMMFHIREILADLLGNRSEAIPLLYGGSVNEDNIGVYVSQADIDGALVGGASLNAGAFCRLIANASRTER